MYKLTPFELKNVKLVDGPLAARQRMNREATLPQQYAKLQDTGRIDGIRRVRDESIDVKTHHFWDSDVAKWIEAAGYSLAGYPDAELEKQLDEVIDLYESAQEGDGYLNSYYSAFAPDKRWTNLQDMHELYCAGHLMEAAVAYYEGAGKRKLLDVMCRVADHIASVFGKGEGQLPGYPGHEEIELALVKLARASGEDRYLNLAKYFIDERGQEPHYFKTEAQARGGRGGRDLSYTQAHKPTRDQDEAVGHAVRAMYLYCGMADVAATTDDDSLLNACKELWDNTTKKKMYITGGVGARHTGEAFGWNYELPGDTAYAETCAAIGLVFFAHRMLQIEATAEYADVLERALYNGVLPGLGIDGMSYFYVNPLAFDGDVKFNRGQNQRQEWFGCSCCPPNIARLLASLGSYIYSTSEDGVYVHMYAATKAETKVGGVAVRIKQNTQYPAEGRVNLEIETDAPAEFALQLRIPDWCDDYTVTVEGASIDSDVVDGYLVIPREWSGKTGVALNLSMPVRQVVSNSHVETSRGCVALQRGPIVYCLEQLDNEAPVATYALSKDDVLTARFDADLLGGCYVIEGEASAIVEDEGVLYRPIEQLSVKAAKLRAIPYALWANRGKSAMTIWMARG